MTTTRIKIADKVEIVAQDILNYIFSYHKTPQDRKNHRLALINILCQVKEQYAAAQFDVTGVAWLERHLVHPFSRKRYQDLDAAEKVIVDNSDQLAISEMIVGLLQRGKCESTSLNTLLMYELISKLNKYEGLNEDERLTELGRHAYSSMLGIRVALRDVLVRKATAIIQERKAHVQLEKQSEIKASSKLTVEKSFLDELTAVLSGVGTRQRLKTKPKWIDEYQPVKKLDMTKYHHVAEKIAAMHGLEVPQKNEEKKVSNVKDTYGDIVGKLEKHFGQKAQPQKLSVKFSSALDAISGHFGVQPRRLQKPLESAAPAVIKLKA